MDQKKKFRKKSKFRKHSKVFKLYKKKKNFFKKNNLITQKKIQNINLNYVTFLLYKNILKLNFLFFTFFKFTIYSKLLKKNKFFNVNLFFVCKLFDEETCLINLKKKNFFFFNKLKASILKNFMAIRFKFKRPIFKKEKAILLKKKILKKKRKINAINKKVEIYKFFFKKKIFKRNTKVFLKSSNIGLTFVLKRRRKVKEPKIVNCKKFFKIRKKESFFYFKKFYFNEKVNKNKILTFFRKLKKKSTIELSNSLHSRILKSISTFFFFFNIHYINFLIKAGYFYINFKPVVQESIDLNFGYFFSSVFFSKIFDLFSLFKKKSKKYIQLFKKKFKLNRKYTFNYLKKLKLKYFNILNFVNRNTDFNLKHLEMDYLTLSFFYLKRRTKIEYNTNFNIFLYDLFFFK